MNQNTKKPMFCALLFGMITSSALARTAPAKAMTRSLGPSGPGSHSEPLRPETVQEKEYARLADEARNEGESLLDEGEFAAAEADFRESLELKPSIPFSYPGLGEALEAQGKTAEALQAYQTLFTPPNTLSSTVGEIRSQMGYAISLSKMGKWPEAVSVYEKALSATTSLPGVPQINIHFDATLPKPNQLQALAYVASGVDATVHSNGVRAFAQFSNAIRDDPALPIANYYYGYGWQKLTPAERAKLAVKPGQREAVKAALEKAAVLGTPEVQAAARVELKSLR